MAFIRNAWYVAAWSHEIGPGALFRRVLLGKPVVFFRTASGVLRALVDRCPHRHAPLSCGRHEGDGVRCLYHGLKVDADGRCIEIPGQPAIPAGLDVPVFPIVERDTLAWIWMGDPAQADATTVPSIPWLGDARWGKKPGYIHYDANYLLIVDNLLDFSHLAWVHAKTLGNAGQGTLRPTIDRTEGGLRVTRWSIDDEPAPFHQKMGNFTGRVDRWNIYEWKPPALLVMDAGVAPTGQGAREGNREGALRFQHLSVQTPETEDSTHYFFAHAHDFQADDPAVSEQIYQQVVVAFEEDRGIIQAQAANMRLDPDARMKGIIHDAGLNQARFLIDRALRAEQDATPA